MTLIQTTFPIRFATFPSTAVTGIVLNRTKTHYGALTYEHHPYVSSDIRFLTRTVVVGVETIAA